MEQSRALKQLLEAADLVTMLEELTAGGKSINPTTLSGLRITLRNVRDSIVSSHDALASGMVARSRTRSSASESAPKQRPNASAPAAGAGEKLQFTRKDLRGSVDKFVE